MRLERAHLCVELECQEVFEMHGPAVCPMCGGRQVVPLATYMNKEAPMRDSKSDRHPLEVFQTKVSFIYTDLDKLLNEMEDYDFRMEREYDDYRGSEDADILGDVMYHLDNALGSINAVDFKEGKK